MLKILQEYQDVFGDVPESQEEREVILSKGMTNKISQKLIDYLEHSKQQKWKTMNFVIYLVPKATPRPRLGNSGVFYVSGAKDNKKIFKELMENREYDFIHTACKFYCDSYLPTPSSMSMLEKYLAEMKLIRPISKPDWDNLGKTYSDMIQGLILMDDSLIIEGRSRKYYSIKPRIEITIQYMEEYDSKFNEKKLSDKLNKLRK